MAREAEPGLHEVPAPTVTTRAAWIAGARPRTLAAGVAPVLVGTAAAPTFSPWRFAAALVVALGLQIGANFANDVQDARRGVDVPGRLGPKRLVASGAASPAAVRAAALAAVGAAGLAGLALAAATSWWLVPAGALAMLALWAYSGGPRPYADLGLGEVMVFVFFGLMATLGSTYVQGGGLTASAWWGAGSMGLLAVAILLANNLRDIPTDASAGKRTLAVRIGDRATRRLYRSVVVAAFALVVVGVFVGFADTSLGTTQWTLFALPAWILAIRPMELVGRAEGRDLIPVLVGTSLTQAVFGALLALGLLLGP